MLGLVANYASSDEEEEPIVVKPTSQSSSSTVQQTSPNTTTTTAVQQNKQEEEGPPKLPTTEATAKTNNKRKRNNDDENGHNNKKKIKKNNKKKKSTRDIASALGLDVEIEEILNQKEGREDEDEAKEDGTSVVPRKPILNESKNNGDDADDDEFGFNGGNDDDDGDEDASAPLQAYEQQSGDTHEKLLSDDFFDNLHEYEPMPSRPTIMKDVITTSDASNAYFDHQDPESLQEQYNLPSNLPPEVWRDLQSSGIREVNVQNRSSAYMEEVRQKQIAMEKQKQLNLMHGQEEGHKKLISNAQRAKNQLSYIAQTAQANAFDYAEKAAAGRANKQAAWKRYGWM